MSFRAGQDERRGKSNELFGASKDYQRIGRRVGEPSGFGCLADK